MNQQVLKRLILSHESFMVKIYNFFGRNRKRFHGERNKLIIKGFTKKNRLNVIGRDNEVYVEGGLTRLSECRITIHGSNNKIIIGRHVVLNGVTLYIEDDNNTISIGDDTWINRNVELAAIEGTAIKIGNDCMFSSNIFIRTGDSHSILNAISGLRINPSRDIELGNHVWVGNGARILKGARIGDNCIISTGAIVTGKEFPANSVLAGIPSKVIKSSISWDRSRKIEFDKNN